MGSIRSFGNPKTPTKKQKVKPPVQSRNGIKPKMGQGPDKGLNGPVSKIVK